MAAGHIRMQITALHEYQQSKVTPSESTTTKDTGTALETKFAHIKLGAFQPKCTLQELNDLGTKNFVYKNFYTKFVQFLDEFLRRSDSGIQLNTRDSIRSQLPKNTQVRITFYHEPDLIH